MGVSNSGVCCVGGEREWWSERGWWGEVGEWGGDNMEVLGELWCEVSIGRFWGCEVSTIGIGEAGNRAELLARGEVMVVVIVEGGVW